MAHQNTRFNINPRYFGLFFIALYTAALFFLSNNILFTDSPLSVIFDNTRPDEIFNLLISLWMIAWLLESLLEVIVSIFKNFSEDDTRKFTYIIGFLLSIIISLSGVRTLDIFFTPEDNASNIQIQLFSLMDIILTAGALAAGSDGIHQITQTFKSLVLFVKKSSKNPGENTSTKLKTPSADPGTQTNTL